VPLSILYFLFYWGSLRRKATWIAASAVMFGLAFVYKSFNPGDYEAYPRCPFLQLTGLTCPGCGSQRAIHHLLNLELSSAFRQNQLMLLSIPYLILGATFEFSKSKTLKFLTWRKRLFGPLATRIVLVIVLVFWIGRNIATSLSATL